MLSDAALTEIRIHWRARIAAAGVPMPLADRLFDQVRTWGDWGPVWGEAAASEEAYASGQAAAGRRVTAGDSFLLASLLYQYGQMVLFHDPRLKDSLSRKREACFRRAGLAEDFTAGPVHAYLRLPSGASAPAPVVVVLPGADSVKEENFSFTDHLVRRGLAAVCPDGPGQGETRRHLPFDPKYESHMEPLFERIAADGRLDGARLGLAGFSFGGYLAPRVAARFPQIRACVPVGGAFDLAHWAQLPDLLQEDFTHLFAARDREQAQRAAAAVSLAEVLPRLRCPLLVVHGKRDGIFPWEHATRMAAAAGGGAETLIYEDGDHCCHNLAHRSKPAIADWLAERLAAL